MTDLCNPTVLRSHLVYHLGGELSNITVADLEECKWNVKKTIFLSLISHSAALKDIKESIDRIQEHRSRELKQLKLSNAVREERIESEKIYRSRFMRCVVMGLEKLEFPPAIAPFADLATDLFEEISIVRNAMAFILEIGVGLKYEFKSAPSSGTRPKSSSSSSSSPVSRNMTTSPVTVPLCTSSVTDMSNNSNNGGDENELPGMSELDLSAISANSDGINLGLPSAPIVGENSSIISDFNNNSGVVGMDNTRHRYSQNVANVNINTNRNQNLRNRNQNSKNEVIERLQTQNEYLTQQLSVLMQSVMKKEEAEFKMSMVFRDLCTILDDLTPNNNSNNDSIDMSSIKTAEDILPVGHPGQSITKEEDAVYRQEIARVERRDKHPLAVDTESDKYNKNKSGNIKNNTNRTPKKSNISYSHSGSSSSSSSKGMWKSVAQKVRALHNQWEETRRSTSSSTRVSVGQHAVSEYCPQPSTLLLRSMLGVHSKGSSQSSSLSPDKSERYDYIPSPTSYNHANGGVDHDAPLIGLDLKRIHGLQRNLVQLADNALTLSENAMASSSSVDVNDDLYNTSEELGVFTIWNGFENSPRNNRGKSRDHHARSSSSSTLQSQSESETLQIAMTQFAAAAQTMLLETAALAPVAAVSRFTGNDNSNNNHSLVGSGLCGLEAIEAVVRDLPPNPNRDRSLDRGGVGMRIALDRAWNEQSALARCLGITQSMLKQWTKAAHKCRLALNRLGDNSLKSIQKGLKKLNKVEEAGDAIFTALQAVENVKKTDLDALGRGTHGVEIASLVHVLRMYSHELSTSTSDLSDVKYELSQAWGMEKKEIDRLNESLTQAGVRSAQAAGLSVDMLTGEEVNNDVHIKYNRRKGSTNSNIADKVSNNNNNNNNNNSSSSRSSSRPSGRPRIGKGQQSFDTGVNTTVETVATGTVNDDRPPWVD